MGFYWFSEEINFCLLWKPIKTKKMKKNVSNRITVLVKYYKDNTEKLLVVSSEKLLKLKSGTDKNIQSLLENLHQGERIIFLVYEPGGGIFKKNTITFAVDVIVYKENKEIYKSFIFCEQNGQEKIMNPVMLLHLVKKIDDPNFWGSPGDVDITEILNPVIKKEIIKVANNHKPDKFGKVEVVFVNAETGEKKSENEFFDFIKTAAKEKGKHSEIKG